MLVENIRTIARSIYKQAAPETANWRTRKQFFVHWQLTYCCRFGVGCAVVWANWSQYLQNGRILTAIEFVIKSFSLHKLFFNSHTCWLWGVRENNNQWPQVEKCSTRTKWNDSDRRQWLAYRCQKREKVIRNSCVCCQRRKLLSKIKKQCNQNAPRIQCDPFTTAKHADADVSNKWWCVWVFITNFKFVWLPNDGRLKWVRASNCVCTDFESFLEFSFCDHSHL